jgi:hypothetical protein
MTKPLTDEELRSYARSMADRGRLLESGFTGFRLAVIPLDAPPTRVAEMRLAFMAGAHYLFSSFMLVLDTGADPTVADLRRMDLIERELREYTDNELNPRVRRKGEN